MCCIKSIREEPLVHDIMLHELKLMDAIESKLEEIEDTGEQESMREFSRIFAHGTYVIVLRVQLLLDSERPPEVQHIARTFPRKVKSRHDSVPKLSKNT